MADGPPETGDLQAMRVDYRKGELLERDAAVDPMDQFAQWFAAARDANVPEPNAMTLATADAAGRPSARIVLLKDFDARGFTFYTNYGSRKAADLAANPRASLLFFWPTLERQIRIAGRATKVSREESAAYFAVRPRSSQLGAWASHQTSILPSREALDAQDRDVAARFEGKDVPLPDEWGGYRLTPDEFEFWQGRSSRLHDRLRYRRDGDAWRIDRLSP